MRTEKRDLRYEGALPLSILNINCALIFLRRIERLSNCRRVSKAPASQVYLPIRPRPSSSSQSQAVLKHAVYTWTAVLHEINGLALLSAPIADEIFFEIL